VPLFDPDDDEFLAPGDMPARIAAACTRLGQRAPQGPGEIVRCVLVSLACKYRLVLERLEQVSGRRIDCIHVIGGGARNRLLCQLTADVTGRHVLAGPVEATALGNVLVQARAAGRVGSLAEIREVAAASAVPDAFEPGDRGAAEADYHRFLAATGLTVQAPAMAT
jgi:rhamnulokinase